MICFEISSDFWIKSQKRETGKSGIFGFLRRNVGNPRRGIALHRRVGFPLRYEAGVPKWHPSGTPRRSYYSHRNKFWIFVPKV